QKITISGGLYKPRSPKNPGAFDFRNYLASQGAYAGLKGEKIVNLGTEPFWGWWKLRKRIINSFNQGLGTPEGLVLSSMVLGRKSVDLPLEQRDLFINVGLAHVLSASGFHVALLLGIILRITRNLSPKQQLIIGVIILLFYAGLTGVQPSICRAVLMGFAILIGQTVQRKIRILGSLLLAATLLLLWQPLWIWNLGFQFSFLSTFGLIVTMPTLIKRLDWIPPAIATVMAVPIAATIWVLPLSLYTFKLLAPYSIPTNIITAPLITIISLGGMISATIALISPTLGSLAVKILYYPIHFLIKLLVFIVNLPGSSYAVGQISLGVMLGIYVILVLIWLNQWWQSYWKLGLSLILGLIIIPITYHNLTLVQVTILAAKPHPVVVIQERGNVSLINLGDKKTIKYNVLPFLTQQGINNINAILVFNSDNIQDWRELNPHVNVANFFHIFGKNQPNSQKISAEKTLGLGSTSMELLTRQPLLVKFQTNDQSWLWITDKINKYQSAKKLFNLQSLVLLFSGKSLSLNTLIELKPKVAITNSYFVPKKVRQELEKRKIELYWTRQDGAIQWQPKQGFQRTLITGEKNNVY
ncbi:MAG TPA: competence protein ComEC, partial [Cyanothece sp. UBA12306]|nr:competence protein ComEC [Cyanothece sp. UBA12306]